MYSNKSFSYTDEYNIKVFHFATDIFLEALLQQISCPWYHEIFRKYYDPLKNPRLKTLKSMFLVSGMSGVLRWLLHCYTFSFLS